MGTTHLTPTELRPGDEVVVPAFGGQEIAEAVTRAGATAVFADIDPRSFCLDAQAAEAAVTGATVALAPVHAFGHQADMVCLRALAQRRGLEILAFDEEPWPEALDARRRRAHADYLSRRLRGVTVPTAAPGAGHAWTQYVVRVPGNGRPDRDAFLRALKARGIECRVPVRIPAHRMPAFRRADIRLPETERAADETLELPLRASMTKRDLHRLAHACNALGGLLMDRAG